MASVQMEMGNAESAKTISFNIFVFVLATFIFFFICPIFFLNSNLNLHIYQKLTELNPNEGYSKYMCLAQLSTGLEAVNYYKKGIELILVEYNSQINQPSTSAQASNDEDDDDGTAISKLDISTAYGSVAEIYLTDLW